MQYAEDSGQGPATTSAIQWTKGPSPVDQNYPNQVNSGSPSDGNNFTQLSVTWTPVIVTVAPSITSTAPVSTGTVGVPYSHTCTADGTTPITFSASGLPTGLSMNSSGVISGSPEVAGLFSGTITASNGTLPNATQAFSIEIAAPPTITSTAPPSTGTVGVSYSHTCTADGTAPITFSASGLPAGLDISSAGAISGIPMEAGLFTGTITAANGTLPNATQAFSIEIIEIPTLVSTVQALDGSFTMSGDGPPNGTYTLLSATDPSLPLASWTEVTTGTFNGTGEFSIARPITPGVPTLYYRLRIP